MGYAIRLRLALMSLVIMVGVLGCDRDHQSPKSEASDLKRAIAEVEGAYAWRDDLNRYEYSEKLRLEEILSVQGKEAAVTVLVACLDDTSPSRSVIDGHTVPLGIVCYQALTQLVYYEPTAPDGDVAADWPGNMSPRASPQEMRVAKDAWKKAADGRLLIFQ